MEEINLSQSLAEQLLTKDQLIWLKAIYQKRIVGEEISIRALLLELRDKLSADFKREEIPRRFLLDTQPTILGLALIDSNNEDV
jgi:hypothetical protein